MTDLNQAQVPAPTVAVTDSPASAPGKAQPKPTVTAWEPPIVAMGNNLLAIKMLVYGNYGTGKTVFAATADDVPEMKPVLYVDCEAGTLSIRGRRELHTYPVREYSDLNSLIGYLRAKALPNTYGTVIIDSITEIAKMVIKQCVVEARAANSNHDRDIAEQRDWFRYTERMRVVIRALRDAPVHIIMTALEREARDEATGAISFGPMAAGQQVQVDLGAYVDIIGRLVATKDGKSRIMHLQPTDKFRAKDRSGLLPTEIENATLRTIYGQLSTLTGGA